MTDATAVSFDADRIITHRMDRIETYVGHLLREISLRSRLFDRNRMISLRVAIPAVSPNEADAGAFISDTLFGMYCEQFTGPIEGIMECALFRIARRKRTYALVELQLQDLRPHRSLLASTPGKTR